MVRPEDLPECTSQLPGDEMVVVVWGLKGLKDEDEDGGEGGFTVYKEEGSTAYEEVGGRGFTEIEEGGGIGFSENEEEVGGLIENEEEGE